MFSTTLHRTIVATYPLKKIFDNRLDFYYKTYQSYFPDNSKLTFYENEICSPIKRGIRLIKELAILNQNKDYIETILQLKKHFNSQLDKIHFTSKLDKLIAILIKHNLLKTVKLILSFKKGL